MLVDEEEVLEKTFRHAPATIATHCEHTPTILRNEEEAPKKFGDEIPFSEHPEIRSAEACLRSSSLAVELARREEARLHVLHIRPQRNYPCSNPAMNGSPRRLAYIICGSSNRAMKL